MKTRILLIVLCGLAITPVTAQTTVEARTTHKSTETIYVNDRLVEKASALVVDDPLTIYGTTEYIPVKTLVSVLGTQFHIPASLVGRTLRVTPPAGIQFTSRAVVSGGPKSGSIDVVVAGRDVTRFPVIQQGKEDYIPVEDAEFFVHQFGIYSISGDDNKSVRGWYLYQDNGKASNRHSAVQIQAKYHWLPSAPLYFLIRNGSHKAPYTLGQISQAAIDSGVAMVNFDRWLAGLPDDVKSDSKLTNLAQHGATVIAALGYVTHTPDKPNDMPQSFFQQAYQATTTSNLGCAYCPAGVTMSPSEQVDGYMLDCGQFGNIETVGHRRWILNPGFQKTGFGYVQRDANNAYFAMEVSDSNSLGDTTGQNEASYDFVGWPSQGDFPVFDGFEAPAPWSISLNPDKYQTPDLNSVNVTLTRLSDHKTWTFDAKHAQNTQPFNYKSNFFNVDTQPYGIPNAIIFRQANANYQVGDTYQVHVTGIKTVQGTPTEIKYTVHFIGLN
jgi:hypothetical protein